MAIKGDWAWLGNGDRIFIPEKKITVDDPSYRYLPLRGYGHVMAVQYGDKVIGWINAEDLGYPDVKSWIRSNDARNAAERPARDSRHADLMRQGFMKGPKKRRAKKAPKAPKHLWVLHHRWAPDLSHEDSAKFAFHAPNTDAAKALAASWARHHGFDLDTVGVEAITPEMLSHYGIETHDEWVGAGERRRRRRGGREGDSVTVGTFLDVLASKIVQYDKRQSTGKYYNPNALGLYLERLNEVRDALAGMGMTNRGDAQALDALRSAIAHLFTSDFPPAKKVKEQIFDYLQTGKKPSLVKERKRRRASRDRRLHVVGGSSAGSWETLPVGACFGIVGDPDDALLQKTSPSRWKVIESPDKFSVGLSYSKRDFLPGTLLVRKTRS